MRGGGEGVDGGEEGVEEGDVGLWEWGGEGWEVGLGVEGVEGGCVDGDFGHDSSFGWDLLFGRIGELEDGLSMFEEMDKRLGCSSS